MATNPKKSKAKDTERKSSKKIDELSVCDDKKDENQMEESAVSVADENTPTPAPPTPKEPTPEPVYEEPVLTQLIVERCFQNYFKFSFICSGAGPINL